MAISGDQFVCLVVLLVVLFVLLGLILLPLGSGLLVDKRP